MTCVDGVLASVGGPIPRFGHRCRRLGPQSQRGRPGFDGPGDVADAAPSLCFAPAVRSPDSDIVAAGSVLDPDMGVLSRGRRDAPVGGSSRLLAALKRPEGSVVSCIDSVITSGGVAQTCKEVCDGESCVGSGVYDGFIVRVRRDSASCSGEGRCRDASINGVFLGCEDTEACYYAGVPSKAVRNC